MHSKKTIRQLAKFDANKVDSAHMRANDFMVSLHDDGAGRVRRVYPVQEGKKTVVYVEYDEWVGPL